MRSPAALLFSLALHWLGSLSHAQENLPLLSFRRAVESFEANLARREPGELIALVSSIERALQLKEIAPLEAALREQGLADGDSRSLTNVREITW